MADAASLNPLKEDADLHSASAEYAARFSGPAGKWLLGVQERIVLSRLKACSNCKILDVGGGHGQIAQPLVSHGYSVRVFGSSVDALTQVRELNQKGRCEVDSGDILNIPYPERHYDVVTCFRLVPHSIDWKNLVGELCRVAKRTVIIDYPVRHSVNALTPLLFGAKKGFEGNTRHFLLFSDNEINEVFVENGFRCVSLTKQFFFPMVIHRALKSPTFSSFIEWFPRVVGLTHLWGSPVIAEFERAR